MSYNASKGPHTFEITIDQEYVKKYLLRFLTFLDKETAHFWLSELNGEEENLIDKYMKEHPFGK